MSNTKKPRTAENPSTQTREPSSHSPRGRLGLLDTISVIIGITIGAGIYETPPLVFANVSGPGVGLGLWAVAGLLSLFGAFTYAELATTYPRSGGDYVYLTRAYGSWIGFLYGWAQLAVIITGSIGMLAYIFADYAAALAGTGAESTFIFAAAAVATLSTLNLFGVVVGKTAQNVLSGAKIIGLAAIVAAGLWIVFNAASAAAPATTARSARPAIETNISPAGAAPPAIEANISPAAASLTSLAAAMVLIFLTYGGWHDAAFFVAEMRDSRQIAHALILGILAIAGIYLLVNAAYLAGLGFEGVRHSKAVAADVLGGAWGPAGARAMALLVMISALGALNGLIFAGSRLYATLGGDHSVFAWLGRWHVGLGSPIYAIAVQAVISLTMIVTVGSRAGQTLLDSVFRALGAGSLSWQGRGGFDTLLRCTAPVFWTFLLLVSASIFVLRRRDRERVRPFRAPLYPIGPMVFTFTCAYMVYSGVVYAGWMGLVGTGLLAAGVPLYLLSSPREPDFNSGSSRPA